MNWHEIFEYANGRIYWKIKPAVRVKIGDEAGSMRIIPAISPSCIKQSNTVSM